MAGYLAYTARSIKDCRSVPAMGDFRGWSGCRQACSCFGTEGDDPPFCPPAGQAVMHQRSRSAVIPDRLARQTTADQ